MNDLRLHLPDIHAGREFDRQPVVKVKLGTTIAAGWEIVDEAVGGHAFGHEFDATDLERIVNFSVRPCVGQRSTIDRHFLPDFSRAGNTATLSRAP